MAEHVEQVRNETTDGGVTTQTTRVNDDLAARRPAENTPNVLARIIWFIAGVIIALLAFRFVFVLLGANSGNGFVDFIYNVSHPFAAPFFGIFSYNVRYGVSRFEFSSLVAMAVYALIAYGLARLVTIRNPRTY
ncbi:MAG TPA: hypothetical protein VFN51_02135 [Candidatus Saccharimonadales bacterium]|nr:hypothetical protein [Candidatus Saccharimonadales bacterium]